MKDLPLKNIFLSIILATSLVSLSPLANAQEQALVSLKQTSKSFTSIAKEVSPAVVNIQSDQAPPDENAESTEDGEYGYEDIPPPLLDLFRNVDPRMQPRRQTMVRQGSGFIITKDGYIVTNNHLVQNATKITVKLLDNEEYIAKIIGTDPQSDVAVLKIQAKNLPTVVLGNSDTAEVGEWVVALGNPFGLSHSLSVGVLSAKGRNSIGIAAYENFLQTDAAINQGNSGGPLLGPEGKVIGINTAIFSRSGGHIGIGFAIPINMAKSIIDQLIAKGSVVRGFLGVQIQDLNKDLADSFGISARKGIIISQVEKDSPAAKGGVQQGDIVISLDEIPVECIGDFRNNIGASKPGSIHVLGILRGNKPLSLKVAVGNLDKEIAAKEIKPEDQQNFSKIGISVQNITPDVVAILNLKTTTGAIISKVKPGSIGEFAGLSKGLVILEVNRHKVADVKQFKEQLAKAGNKNLLFLVQNQYGSRYLVVNVE